MIWIVPMNIEQKQKGITSSQQKFTEWKRKLHIFRRFCFHQKATASSNSASTSASLVKDLYCWCGIIVKSVAKQISNFEYKAFQKGSEMCSLNLKDGKSASCWYLQFRGGQNQM
jgi:hypothetical protein